VRRLVGNDKVPPEQRYRLLVAKAVKQGMGWSHKRWWPALEMLRKEDREPVRRFVIDATVWRAVSGTIGNPRSMRRVA
jgi:hypothetical protein